MLRFRGKQSRSGINKREKVNFFTEQDSKKTYGFEVRAKKEEIDVKSWGWWGKSEVAEVVGRIGGKVGEIGVGKCRSTRFRLVGSSTNQACPIIRLELSIWLFSQEKADNWLEKIK